MHLYLSPLPPANSHPPFFSILSFHILSHSKHTHSPSPMENRFKMRISRMFRSSFGSCRTKNISDVMEKAVFAPQTSDAGFQLIDFSSPKARPLPSICRPKGSGTSETINEGCIVSVKDSLPRRKVSEWSSPFIWANMDGRSCPPASPITPLKPIYEKEFGLNEKIKNSVKDKRNKKKKKQQHIQKRIKPREIFPFNSCAKDDNFGGYWWYSSDDDDEGGDETDTLFSSKSLSSDSSRSRRQRRSRQKKHGCGRVASGNENNQRSKMGVLPLQGKVKDTFAVVKRSRDPYNDFRTSMVEMIVEKHIFAPKDLEHLLQCFLSLNSHHHHRIIVEVFTEIWEALFSDWF